MTLLGRAVLPILEDRGLVVRGLRTRDARDLERVLLAHREWLQPWEATLPHGQGRWNVRGSVRSMLEQAQEGKSLPFVMEHEGELVGQLTVGNIQYGAVMAGTIGYWISPEVAGRGFTPTAVALVTDYCFQEIGLHRMEICIRPENAASLRVVEKLGFTYEGRRNRYIHIDGDWRDHYCYGIIHETVPEGVLNRWKSGRVDPTLAQRPASGPFA
ncbi:GNAT family N-acetyltransferase [Gulosibacter bifidus]|uniref:GNAT family N-acetyltransferase n=1 Tax=Gulosibacter bifidus TaxID=272239 RepID=A0ABW5RHV3_9MICO|nr:GNAT family protein [Gulosibacter bifidus]